MGDIVSPRESPSATEVRMQMRVMREALIARKVTAQEVNSVIKDRARGITGLRRFPGWMGTRTIRDDRLRRMIVVWSKSVITGSIECLEKGVKAREQRRRYRVTWRR